MTYVKMWLGEADMVPDDGTPAPIEQPTEIKTRLLSQKVQDDRVRTALGMPQDYPLADVSYENLTAYYDYFTANLKCRIFTTD
jgi:hypothetical protein